MISYKTRNKIRENFSQFNKKYSSPEYPTQKSIDKDTDIIEPTNTYIEDPVTEKSITPVKLKEVSSDKKLTVHYSGEKLLDKSLTIRSKKMGEVTVCVYRICNTNTNPYLLFSLFRTNSELDFFRFNMDGKNKTELINVVTDKYKKGIADITYKGIFTQKENHTVFFEYTEKQESEIIDEGTLDSDMCWALTSEIVNFKKVLTTPVANFVTQFFVTHYQFNFLKDDLGMIYEIPIVGHFGSSKQSVLFIAAFGALRGNAEDKYGPYYYFGNYEKALEYSKSNNAEYSGIMSFTDKDDETDMQGAIIRSALFLENVAMPNISSNKKHLSNNWAENYQSIISTSEKDKKKVLYVIKKYDQYSPIEYYIL